MKKHVAKNGAKAGQWVDCPAKTKCRNGGLHVTAETLLGTQKWLSHVSGRKIFIKEISHLQVQNFCMLEQIRKEAGPNDIGIIGVEDSPNRERKTTNDSTKNVKEKLNDLFSGWSVKEL